MFMSHLPELFAVLLLGLIFFGPKRLPEIGESVGKSIRDFKRGLSHIEESPRVSAGDNLATVEVSEPIHADHPAM
jgi:TatA/E family protein of Tat protein translocase